MVGSNAPRDTIDLAESNVVTALGELDRLFARIDLLTGALATLVLAGIALLQMTHA